IRNNAQIETSGDGAAGIFVLGNDAHIENYGTIITHGGIFSDKHGSKLSEFFSEGIDAEGDRFYIANYGGIRVEGDASSALIGEGIDGVIINAGRIDSTAAGGIVIFAFGEGSQVINTGQVIIAADGVSGMSSGPRDVHLTNWGDINVTGDHTRGMLGL